MDNTNAYRGWDLWYENGRLATHIINTWPSNALKVVMKNPLNPGNAWHHVFVTYDGSAKVRAASRSYVNGELQPTDVAMATLKPKSTTKTTVPFKLGQRHTTERLEVGCKSKTCAFTTGY